MNHNSAEFKIVIPIEKSADSRMIVGMAAGLGKDAQKQRMSERAIQSVARQAKSGTIPFKDHHAKLDSILASEIGFVKDAVINDDFSLRVEVELEEEGEHPTADYLYRSIEKGKQYGMSIGGKANEFHIEMEDGEPIVVIDDMVLEEISVTTRPAFTHSLGTVVRKAIDAAESESAGDETMSVTNVTTEITPAAPPVASPVPEAVVSTASAPETPVVETVVEKAVSADTARENQKLLKLAKLQAEISAILEELQIGTLNTTEPVAVEKSQPAADDTSTKELEVLKSLVDDQKKELEVLKSMIPSTPIPGVPQKTDEIDELATYIASLSPSEKIKFGLRALHGEK